MTNQIPLGANAPQVRTLPVISPPPPDGQPAQVLTLPTTGPRLDYDDVLVLNVYNVTSGLTLRVDYRIYPLNNLLGRPIDGSFVMINPTTDGNLNTVSSIHLGPGLLDSVYVSVIAGSTLANQTRAEVDVQNQSSGHTIRQLLQGYITSQAPLGFSSVSGLTPSQYGTPFRTTTSGNFSGTQSYTIPTGQIYVFQSCIGNVSTDANAGNRFVEIEMKDSAGGTVVFAAQSKVAQAANQPTWLYYFAPLGDSSTSNVNTVAPTIQVSTPNFIAFPGYQIVFYSTGFRGDGDTASFQLLFQIFSSQ